MPWSGLSDRILRLLQRGAEACHARIRRGCRNVRFWQAWPGGLGAPLVKKFQMCRAVMAPTHPTSGVGARAVN